MDHEILYNTEGKFPRDFQKQNNYETAYHAASQILSKSDILSIVEKSGADILNKNGARHILLRFINDELLISTSDIAVLYHNKGDEVPLWLKILALHYLIYAKGTMNKGDQITFKQLEGGLGYFPAFQRRTIIPLIDHFGGNLNDFISAGEMTGGTRTELGDAALLFDVFPRIDVRFVIWKGDDEFPSDGSVIFDSSIADYLTTEDIAVCCNMIAVMMIKNWTMKKK